MAAIQTVGAWLLAHKSEIVAFLAAGALAVTPEKYMPIAQAVAGVFAAGAYAKHQTKAAANHVIENTGS